MSTRRLMRKSRNCQFEAWGRRRVDAGDGREELELREWDKERVVGNFES